VNDDGATAMVDPKRYSTSIASIAFMSRRIRRSPLSALRQSPWIALAEHVVLLLLAVGGTRTAERGRR
jgi:hypothetical protein